MGIYKINLQHDTSVLQKYANKQTYLSICQIEEQGLFGVDGLLGELIAFMPIDDDFDDDFDDDEKLDTPLSGERGDRLSSPSKVPNCQEYLILARGLP